MLNAIFQNPVVQQIDWPETDLKGSSIRQEYLETAIFWAASAEGKTIEGYMSEHQHDPSAVTIWNYFRSVIDWVQAIFPKKRKEMKGLPWGLFYNDQGKAYRP